MSIFKWFKNMFSRRFLQVKIFESEHTPSEYDINEFLDEHKGRIKKISYHPKPEAHRSLRHIVLIEYYSK